MAASIQSFGMSEQLSIRRPYAICRRLAWFPGTFSRHAFPKPSDLPPQASSDLSSSALRAEAAHVRWRSRFSRADNGPPAGTRCGGPSKRPQEQRSMGGMHVNAHPRGNDRTTKRSIGHGSAVKLKGRGLSATCATNALCCRQRRRCGHAHAHGIDSRR